MSTKEALKALEKRIIIGPAKGEWFHLDEPDTKFKPEGDYKVTIYPTQEAMRSHFEDMKAILEAALPIYQEIENEDAKKKGKKPKTLKASDTQPWLSDEMEDGTIQLKLKTSATFVDPKTGVTENKNLPVIDSTGKYLTKAQIKAAKIGNGSTTRVVVTAKPYHMVTQGVGISLRLEKVQIIDVVQYGGSGTDNEMGAVEGGGWAAPEVPTEAQDQEMAQSDGTNYTV